MVRLTQKCFYIRAVTEFNRWNVNAVGASSYWLIVSLLRPIDVSRSSSKPPTRKTSKLLQQIVQVWLLQMTTQKHMSTCLSTGPAESLWVSSEHDFSNFDMHSDTRLPSRWLRLVTPVAVENPRQWDCFRLGIIGTLSPTSVSDYSNMACGGVICSNNPDCTYSNKIKLKLL